MTDFAGRLFCFGMPKCGTTTVSALLAAHPAISLHNQKEPGDFLQDPPRTSLSGYEVSPQTRWLADFTTTYGLSDRRDTFFSGLRAAGIDPRQARFVLCLREPADMAHSYLRHIVERRCVDLTKDLPAIRAEILSACDFGGAIDVLRAEAGPGAAFVVRFDDLTDAARQVRLADQLYTWLGLEVGGEAVAGWANAGGSVSRYPAALDRLAGLVRRTDWVRRMSPQNRARLRGLLSVVPDATPLPQDLVDDTLAWLADRPTIQSACAIFAQTKSGPNQTKIFFD